ncbi:hypothetical protein HDU86_007489 [Geranomyces michiganensis]|nr:hypothetical protein HDU86_007489 [Geranomyces michiganensis]
MRTYTPLFTSAQPLPQRLRQAFCRPAASAGAILGLLLLLLLVFGTLSLGGGPRATDDGRLATTLAAEESSSSSSSSSAPPSPPPPPEQQQPDTIASNSSSSSSSIDSAPPAHGHNPHHAAHGEQDKDGNDRDDDDDEPKDHESMHGEPGVADVLGGVFGSVNSMTMEPDDDGGKWKTALNDYKFGVEQGTRPPIFVAKPLKAGFTSGAAVDTSLIAVLTRAIADSVAQAESSSENEAEGDASQPAQFISFNCHDSVNGYAHDALLAAVRGAAIANCFLPADALATLTPPIMAAARLNLVEDKMRLHALPHASSNDKSNSTDSAIALDEFPLASNRVAMMHVAGLSMGQIMHLLLRLTPSESSLGQKITHLVIDIPSTTSVSDTDLQALLNTMHDTYGFDLCILPHVVSSSNGQNDDNDRTYNKIAHASFMGSEYAADSFATRFVYVPKTDYDLVKETVEDGGVQGKMRLWWVKRDDAGVKQLMSTRHHAH